MATAQKRREVRPFDVESAKKFNRHFLSKDRDYKLAVCTIYATMRKEENPAKTPKALADFVYRAQKFLKRQGLYNGELDGKFGIGTLRALEQYTLSAGARVKAMKITRQRKPSFKRGIPKLVKHRKSERANFQWVGKFKLTYRPDYKKGGEVTVILEGSIPFTSNSPERDILRALDRGDVKVATGYSKSELRSALIRHNVASIDTSKAKKEIYVDLRENQG